MKDVSAVLLLFVRLKALFWVLKHKLARSFLFQAHDVSIFDRFATLRMALEATFSSFRWLWDRFLASFGGFKDVFEPLEFSGPGYFVGFGAISSFLRMSLAKS